MPSGRMRAAWYGSRLRRISAPSLRPGVAAFLMT